MTEFQSGGGDAGRGVYVISVAAELAGMHAQTLRQYDRLGLVTPQRTTGGGRRYSNADIDRLREVQRLSNEGVSLTGIQRILDLENQVLALRTRVHELDAEVSNLIAQQAISETERQQAIGGARVFAAGRDGIIELPFGQRAQRVTSRSLVVYRGGRG